MKTKEFNFTDADLIELNEFESVETIGGESILYPIGWVIGAVTRGFIEFGKGARSGGFAAAKA